MDKFIGIDVHKASCTLAVVSQTGRPLAKQVVETNGRALVEALQAIKGNKRVVLEEGTQSAWLYEVLKKHVAEVAVVTIRGVQQNKSDARDALFLAQNFRLGQFKSRVYKEKGPFGGLKANAALYEKIVGDHVRVQNRIKAVLRSRGEAVRDSNYNQAEQARLLKVIPSEARESLALLFEQHARLTELRENASTLLEKQAKKHKALRYLTSVPGIGMVRAAEIMAVVVDPSRFHSKRKFWAYCGFAIDTRSSADWEQISGKWEFKNKVMTRGLNRNHNSTMKRVFKGAAQHIVNQKNSSDPLYATYVRLLADGIKPPLAKLTVARKIAAIALALWKKQEVYDPSKVHHKITIA